MPIGTERQNIFDVALVLRSTNTTFLLAALHNMIFLPVKEIILIDCCSYVKLADIIPTYLSELENFNKVQIYSPEVPWSPSLSLAKSVLLLESNIIEEDFFYNNDVWKGGGLYKFKENRLEKITTYLSEIIHDNNNNIHLLSDLFSEERFLVLKPLYGIGNRLRALLTTLDFSVKHKYKLYVVWDKTPGYDESPFNEYFQIKNFRDIIFINQAQILSDIDFNVKIYSGEQKKLINLEADKHIYLESSSYLCNVLYTESIFNPSCGYFKELTATESIEYILKYIKQKLIKGAYNVFHIRRGDALTSQFSEHYKISSIYLFAKYINESNKINVVLSDDYDYCTKFLDVLCPNKYIIINRHNFNKCKSIKDSKYGINMDVVDFFLFRDADKIYATNFSSYSYVAAHVFNKFNNYIVVKDTNKYILNQWPDCINMLPYVNSFKNIEGENPFVAILDINKNVLKDTIIYRKDSINMIQTIYDKYYCE